MYKTTIFLGATLDSVASAKKIQERLGDSKCLSEYNSIVESEAHKSKALLIVTMGLLGDVVAVDTALADCAILNYFFKNDEFTELVKFSEETHALKFDIRVGGLKRMLQTPMMFSSIPFLSNQLLVYERMSAEWSKIRRMANADTKALPAILSIEFQDNPAISDYFKEMSENMKLLEKLMKEYPMVFPTFDYRLSPHKMRGLDEETRAFLEKTSGTVVNPYLRSDMKLVCEKIKNDLNVDAATKARTSEIYKQWLSQYESVLALQHGCNIKETTFTADQKDDAFNIVLTDAVVSDLNSISWSGLAKYMSSKAGMARRKEFASSANREAVMRAFLRDLVDFDPAITSSSAGIVKGIEASTNVPKYTVSVTNS